MTATTVPATAGPRGSRLLGLARELAHDPTGTYEAVMLANPSVIKRPVVDWGYGITVEFNAEAWAARV